ncbi:MAG TPA: FliH/SctL family protein [Polyangiaceae bacterium]|nr:FliH/SctL family protein [Polyangiaceae bacterium]
MSIAKGRVLRAEGDTWKPVALPQRAPVPSGRRIPREIVAAEERAQQIVQSAEQRSRELVESAFKEVAGVKLRAQTEGRAEAAAALAARAIELKALETRADERALDRVVEVAVVLAERLLGESLAADAARVRSLARQALSEARGARSVKIHAHPADIAQLKGDTAGLGLDAGTLTFVEAPERARGHLLLETDIGVLDAELGPQLQRLGARIRGSLGS